MPRLFSFRTVTYPINNPASVADKYDANVPQSKARIPSLAKSLRRSGANAPIPPICMPTEEKFANPQIAKLTISNDFSEMMLW